MMHQFNIARRLLAAGLTLLATLTPAIAQQSQPPENPVAGVSDFEKNPVARVSDLEKNPVARAPGFEMNPVAGVSDLEKNPVARAPGFEMNPVAGAPGFQDSPLKPQASSLLAAPPSPAEAMDVYRTIEPWVRGWAVPDDDALVEVPAASVTLRLAGRIIGRGNDTTGDDRTIARAVRSALAEARDRLPIDRDALYAEHLQEAAGRVTISIELAGSLVPFRPESLGRISTDLDAGLDGVGLRVGDRVGVIFPARMLATNTPPGSAAGSLASRLLDDPTAGLVQPAELRKNHGAVYYHFRTTHLAQPAPGQLPIFLHRGGRIVGNDAINTAMLRRFADGMADHLRRRLWPGPEPLGMLGPYDPCQGDYTPLNASPREQALVAWALLRYASTPGVGDAEQARTAAAKLIADLAVVAEDEPPPWDEPASAAMCVLALTELQYTQPLPDSLSDLDRHCSRAVASSIDEQGHFSDDVPGPERCLLAHALARLSRRDAGVSMQAATAAVRGVFMDTPPGRLVSQMPWLGWAELELATDAVPSAVALREMRSTMWHFQMTPMDAGPDNADLVGGIVFPSAPNPLPSWQSARPAAVIATMLADGRLTEPGEVSAELAHLLGLARFLRQLAADEATGFMYADPSRSAWGVRRALWDQRMPADATAMTLLSVTETLRSLRALSGEDRPEPRP